MIKRHIAAAVVTFIILLLGFDVPDAAAWVHGSGIGYNGQQLTSYSLTYKEWWDEDVGGDCAYWEYDEEWEEYYCAQWLMWINYASVWGVLWKPSGAAHAAAYLEDQYWGGCPSSC